MNRAEKRRQQKLAKKAAKKARRTAANAGTFDLQNAIDKAIAHHTAGRLKEAEAEYQRLLQTEPQNPVILHLMGALKHETGHYESALTHINQALTHHPNFPQAHNSHGNVLKALGRFDEALASYKRALAITPQYASAHYNMGETYLDLNKPSSAQSHFENAIAANPDFIDAHNALGLLSLRQGQPEQAVAHFQNVIKLNTNSSEAHNNLGIAWQSLGDLKQARACFKKALALNPVQCESHHHLAMVKTHTEYDQDIQDMETVLATPGLADAQKMHLAFGLGKAFEDLKDYTKAFAHFSQANAYKRATLHYKTSDSVNFMQRIQDVFSANLFNKHAPIAPTNHAKPTGPCPIFIIGLPRSGTTLVEQILSQHPDVHGAGELTLLGDIVTSNPSTTSTATPFPECIKTIQNQDINNLKHRYCSALSDLNPNAKFVTDKMPDNFLNVGLIKLIFPQTKVIHCRRNPLDTGLSLFKNYFADGGHPYAYDLIEIAAYIKNYQRIMTHWETTIPDFVYDLCYEDLVTNPLAHAQALFQHCGLSWDPSYLKFYNTKHPVMTASAVQVRHPIHSDSVHSWKRYETQLTPLIEALN